MVYLNVLNVLIEKEKNEIYDNLKLFFFFLLHVLIEKNKNTKTNKNTIKIPQIIFIDGWIGWVRKVGAEAEDETVLAVAVAAVAAVAAAAIAAIAVIIIWKEFVVKIYV